MPFLPRRATGPRAWWLDVAVSVAALGAAQAIVLGGDTLLERLGRGGEGNGFDSALVLERVPGDGSGPDALAPLAVTLDGTVAGLYPGAVIELALEVRNPVAVDVQLDRVTITVGTPDREGCPADAVLIGTAGTPGSGSEPLDLRLVPDASAVLAVPVAMATDAPSACQGATFPLAYATEGTLP
jgi:hypothetical protein